MHIESDKVIRIAREILARQKLLPRETAVMENGCVLFNLVGALAVAIVQIAEGDDAAHVLIDKILSSDAHAVRKVFSKYHVCNVAVLEEEDRRLHERYSPMSAKTHAERNLARYVSART